MLLQEIIRRKRDGETLEREEIQQLARGIATGSASDAQAAAFAMAVFFRGMSAGEAAELTLAMRDSGTVLRWHDLGLAGPILDKHSTGGVGDKVSLMLAPLIAACGGFVPMISGRGLGHTGGTLDKLDAIPGYGSQPRVEKFRRVVAGVGCAIIGQTADLAPADRRLYAIRDVTATVESIPLITSSILSKKLAAGLSGLVMDVKTGNGAFAETTAAAVDLARSIVSVAGQAGLPCSALITDMNEVLGWSAGNAVEVQEAVDYLSNSRRNERLHEVVFALGAELLLQSGLHPDTASARSAMQNALDRGEAAERFARMVAALGGPGDLCERPGAYLPRAPIVHPVYPMKKGVVRTVDTRAVGVMLVELGAGRKRASDAIDHAVGVTDFAGIGSPVDTETPLAMIHVRDPGAATWAEHKIRAAVHLSDAPPNAHPLILQRIAQQ